MGIKFFSMEPFEPEHPEPPDRASYPFGSIQAGQMFLVECPAEESKAKAVSVSASAGQWSGRRNLANPFQCRVVPDGILCLRVK
jgi:hypothetical protein